MRTALPQAPSAQPRVSRALQWVVAVLGLAYIVGLAVSDPQVAKTLGPPEACGADVCTDQRGNAALDSQARLH